MNELYYGKRKRFQIWHLSYALDFSITTLQFSSLLRTCKKGRDIMSHKKFIYTLGRHVIILTLKGLFVIGIK